MHAKLLSGGQDDATHNRLGTAGMQGTGGTGRPGCGAGGQRRSQDDTQTTSAARLDAAAEPGQASRHGPGRGAGGRRRGLAGQRVDAPSEARSADGGRAAAHEHTKQPGTTSNAAGGPPPTGTPSSPAPHEHTKQPGTTTRSSTARNTSGATHHRGIAKPPGPAGTGRLNQHQRIIEESRQCRDYRDRFPGARSRCRA